MKIIHFQFIQLKKSLSEEKITYAALGKFHALIITSEKNVYTWMGMLRIWKLGLKPEKLKNELIIFTNLQL